MIACEYSWAFRHIGKTFWAIEAGARDCKDSIALHKELRCPVYAFEADPAAITVCKNNLMGVDGVYLIEQAVSDHDGFLDFYCGDRLGVSSAYKISKEYKEIDEINQSKAIRVPCTKIDTFTESAMLNGGLLCLDLQGGELAALKGATNTLAKVNCIVCEVAEKPVYEGQPLIDDIDRFLSLHSFRKVTYRKRVNGWWGDAIWKR